MKNHRLHIIDLNVPYPADYGGAIDMFYKIKALHQCGAKIILHCFKYGRDEQPELEQYCEKVYYYQRNTHFISTLSPLPYIVYSRKNPQLLDHLLDDNAPILFEGVHTCYYLNHPKLKNRLKMVRAHNVEADYYAHLAKNEPIFWKKLYFLSESQKLKRFERQLKNAHLVLAVTEKDRDFFAQFCPKVINIPVFHTNESLDIQEGRGNYILYHGDLSSNENITAAHYLIDHIFSKIDLPVVIAGSNPPKSLEKAANDYSHIRLISNPTTNEIDQLIQDAQINLLITFQPTGLKLKLLHALSSGRFCLVNRHMLSGTQLHELCLIAEEDDAFIGKILEYFPQPFSAAEIARRQEIFVPLHSNRSNAERILQEMERFNS